MAITMLDSADYSFRINPYSRWVHEHPERLLSDPRPDLLENRRRRHPSDRVMVELGSGSGNFLLQLAAFYPDFHAVGFELRYKRLVKSARKLEKRNLQNVWVLRETAENFAHYFTPSSVDRVFINFPDPWPKSSQWKKRMVNPLMLDRVERTLKPGGTFHLKTDHSGYFLHCLSLIRQCPGMRLHTMSNDLNRHRLPGPRLESEFEQLFISKRKSVFYLVLEKNTE